MSDPQITDISLSKYTSALLAAIKSIKSKTRPDDISKIMVSQTVSFFALVYERIRNAVEFREDHLILRAAIERIIKRRLSLNPEGQGEAENLIRELLWARYFSNGSLGGSDILKLQNIIDKYLVIKKQIVTGRETVVQEYFAQFIINLMTCELEEALNPESTSQQSSFTYFIYQVLRRKIKIEGLSEEQKDAFFLVAIEKAYGKSDKAYQQYHLFTTLYKKVEEYSISELQSLTTKLPTIFKRLDDMITSPYVDSLMKFCRKQLPSFIVLFEIVKTKGESIELILSNKEKLWNEVDITCREKYQQLGIRVRTLAIRSFIYIFLTKMIFALILELPVSRILYGEINNTSILINSIFPPFLMLAIVAFFRVPDDSNTKKIYNRIVETIDDDPNFETQIAYMPKKPRIRRPTLIFGFTVFYSMTFFITLILIYELLLLLNFNLVSQAIFIFFVSVITFFSYRIKQMVNEFKLEDKENILTPIVDFFFMPILSLGKFFSSELSKLNFFIFIFDFLIEAPFKMIFEIVEEWISFVRKRKEEII